MDQKQHRIILKCLQQFSDLTARLTQTDLQLTAFFSPLADAPHIPSRTIILFRFLKQLIDLSIFLQVCPNYTDSLIDVGQNVTVSTFYLEKDDDRE